MNNKDKKSKVNEEKVVKIGDDLEGEYKEAFLADCRKFAREFVKELKSLPKEEYDKFFEDLNQ